MTNPPARSGNGAARQSARIIKWVCNCQEPPVLLATYDSSGRVNIKSRDRYWHVEGRVHTICPRCGTSHVLDPHARTA